MYDKQRSSTFLQIASGLVVTIMGVIAGFYGCALAPGDLGGIVDEVPSGVCCTPGDCDDAISKINCETGGNVWLDDAVCSGIGTPCAGACCIETTCSLAIYQNACTNNGGDFKGIGSRCSDMPDPCAEPSDDAPPDGADDDVLTDGACCDEGVCQLTSVGECAGQFVGIDTTCDGIDCTKGACCEFLPGQCGETTAAECNADEDSTYLGDGLTCANANCDAGACCDSEGGCTEVAEDACDAQGHDFAGIGTTCASGACALGACCENDSGPCTVVTRPDCDELDGAYLGAGSTCESDTCDLGLCCGWKPNSNDPLGTCLSDASEGGCLALAGTFAGFGIGCENNPFEDSPITIQSATSNPNTELYDGTAPLVLSVEYGGAPTFPLRIIAWRDTDDCPEPAPFEQCEIAFIRDEFRIDADNGSNTISISEWTDCPAILANTGPQKMYQPWRVAILDGHCRTSNEVSLLITCTRDP